MATEIRKSPSSVVIVEEGDEIIVLIRNELEREGFVVRVAPTGEAILETILKSPPSLILLDLSFPHVMGFEMCRRLRAETSTARVPILILTVRTNVSDRVRGLNLGADDYVTKPFSMRELVARVNALVRQG